MRAVTEHEYRLAEETRKAALAAMIIRSRMSYAAIARETGVERRAIRRAVDMEGIRFDTYVRLELYLSRLEKEGKL